MDLYLMYLRKSRMDTDYENVSVKETLSRHRTILENFCKAKKLHVVEVLEEVVSGESLYARPKMMQLLELINTGATLLYQKKSSSFKFLRQSCFASRQKVTKIVKRHPKSFL